MQHDPAKLPHFVSCSGCGESFVHPDMQMWVVNKGQDPRKYKKGDEEGTDNIFCDGCKGNPIRICGGEK